jgi:hypothetical protein
METDWRWTGPRQAWESPDPSIYNVIRQYMAINVAKTRFDYSMNNLLRHTRVRSPFSMFSFPFHCIPSISFLCLFPSSLAFYPSWTSHPFRREEKYKSGKRDVLKVQRKGILAHLVFLFLYFFVFSLLPRFRCFYRSFPLLFIRY